MTRSPIIIAGLGNVGREYETTRHNAGFLFIDWLAERLGVSHEFSFDSRHDADTAQYKNGDERVLLVKPRTMMNLSGDAVAQIASFLSIPADHVCVVYDEIDLPFGATRFRLGGSSAGHNGIQSVLSRMGTEDVARLRIGINQENRVVPTRAFVLQSFAEDELAALPDVFSQGLSDIQEHWPASANLSRH